MNRQESLDILMPVIQALATEGYVFPLGGGVEFRDDGSVDVHIRQSNDPYLVQALTSAAPEIEIRFYFSSPLRHAVSSPEPGPA